LFILAILASYAVAGIIIGAVVAFIPLWFAPDSMADAFGGKVWHDQESLKPAYVGAVMIGVGTFFGLLFAIPIGIAHLVCVALWSASHRDDCASKK